VSRSQPRTDNKHRSFMRIYTHAVVGSYASLNSNVLTWSQRICTASTHHAPRETSTAHEPSLTRPKFPQAVRALHLERVQHPRNFHYVDLATYPSGLGKCNLTAFHTHLHPTVGDVLFDKNVVSAFPSVLRFLPGTLTRGLPMTIHQHICQMYHTAHMTITPTISKGGILD
jgi:hypothetical protein